MSKEREFEKVRQSRLMKEYGITLEELKEAAEKNPNMTVKEYVKLRKEGKIKWEKNGS
jgi:Cu/Ag efflux pump CusA